MRTVEISRAGELSISDELDEMHRWLDAEGIRPTDLRAVRIDERHVIFMATFEEAIEADLFVRQFGELNTVRLKMAAKAVSN